MTVGAETPINTYTGNGSTTVFAYTFRIEAQSEIKIYFDEVEQTSGFSASGIGDNGGGSVTFTTAPGNDVVVLFLREMPTTRAIDYQNSGDFKAGTVNEDIDRVWLKLQEMERDLDYRTLNFDITAPRTPTLNQLPTPIEGYSLVWNADGSMGNAIHSTQDAIDAGESADAALVSELAAAESAAAAAASALTAEGVNPGEIGDINNPIVHMPLRNSLAMLIGDGAATFARSTTATYVDRQGVLQTAAIDEPRFEKEGLLVEGASTNLLIRSQEFNLSWVTANTVVVANSVEAPDGTTTADTITATAPNGTIKQTVTIASDTDVRTFSVYVKEGTATEIKLHMQYIGFTTAVLTWTAGVPVVTSGTATVSGKLKNDFYRITMSVPNVSHTSLVCFIVPDGVGTGSVYVWNGQLEELPFATSAIPTTTVAVTRTADDLSIPFDNNFPVLDDDFSVVVDFNVLGLTAATNHALYAVAGITDNELTITPAGVLTFTYGSGADTKSAVADGTMERAAGVLTSLANEAFIDGVGSGSPGTGTTPSGTPTGIDIGHDGGATPLYGHLANFHIYDIALSDNAVRIA